MTNSINRRAFLKTSAALATVAGTKATLAADNTEGNKSNPKQEYYELRTYKTTGPDKKKMVEIYLETALIPALNRMGIDRIGIFTNIDQPNDFSVYVLIPYSTLDTFAAVNPKLLADHQYQNAAQAHFAADKKDPVFTRIHSRFYKAFEAIPVIETPKQTADKKPRIFELRIYQSHTEEKAALKVDMFNTGEVQLMRDTQLAPVFFGEALIGDDVPNLAYMLSASDMEAHKAHWKVFGGHPEWKRMSTMPKYKDTVSKITNFFLTPTPYSQI